MNATSEHATDEREFDRDLFEDALEQLRDLRGAFEQGHTSEDVDSTLDELAEATGIECCVVWAFEDMYGFGGDSEMFCIGEHTKRPTLYELPPGLWDYLTDPDSEFTPEQIMDGPKRGRRVRYAPQASVEGRNYAPRKSDDELG